MHNANCKVWGRRNNGLGLFVMVQARPLSSSEGKSECCSTQWHCRQFCASNFVATVWEGPFLFQHNKAPVHKARFMQKWFVEISVEELDWHAKSPDLNPIKHV